MVTTLALCALLLAWIPRPFDGGAGGDGRAASGDVPRILPERERAELRDRLLEERMREVLPRLMREEGVDCWVLVSREYDEDPVLETMLPSTWLRARRRTILVAYDPGADAALELLAVARYDVGKSFRSAWNPEEEPDQWKRLADLLAERSPERIGIDVSPTFGHADGLGATQHEELLSALSPELRERVVSAETLAVRWLETRTRSELDLYPSLCRLAHRILAEGLSSRAIVPGHTTTDDLAWWYRDRLRELGLDTWFHPSVSVQRAQGGEASRSFASRPDDETIRRGDLVHVDFGISYLGLHTDQQQHAYVLRLGETEAPRELAEALRVGNRLQDVLTGEFRTGRTGNEILAAALERARGEGIDATIYTHPLGYHGHGAGPAIGMWDQQGGVPGTGDFPLHPGTVHSIELRAAVPLAAWGGQDVLIMLEEDAWFDGDTVRYLDGRQTELHLVR